MLYKIKLKCYFSNLSKAKLTTFTLFWHNLWNRPRRLQHRVSLDTLHMEFWHKDEKNILLGLGNLAKMIQDRVGVLTNKIPCHIPLSLPGGAPLGNHIPISLPVKPTLEITFPSICLEGGGVLPGESHSPVFLGAPWGIIFPSVCLGGGDHGESYSLVH